MAGKEIEESKMTPMVLVSVSGVEDCDIQRPGKLVLGEGCPSYHKL